MARTRAIGKRIRGSLYLHRDALPQVDEKTRSLVEAAAGTLADDGWNVVRLDAAAPGVIAFLDYEPFEEVAFPALRRSWRVDTTSGQVFVRRFSQKNPPILHRKELMLAPEDPRIGPFAALTCALEERGVFRDMAGMGTRVPWEERLREAGIALTDHEIGATASERVERYRTAIVRDRLSAPMQALHRHGIMTRSTTLLDYGCGQGDDVRALSAAGYDAVGWDPYHAPEGPRRESDVVNLGFVLNVIEDPDERRATLKSAYTLARRCLSVAVMVTGKADVSGLTPYRDGYLTRRKTFQKYFAQAELRSLIDETLGVEPIATAPGLFFVFKDETLEQRFLVQRHAPRALDPALLAARLERPERQPAIRRVPARRSIEDRFPELLTAYGNLVAALGRAPAPEELPPDLVEVAAAAGANHRALAMAALARTDGAALERARERRRGELMVFFAVRALKGRRAGDVPPEIKRDARALFGSSAKGTEAGVALLTSIANPELIASEARSARDQGIGWLGEDGYFVHRRDLDNLALPLRAYVAVALSLIGSLEEAQVIRLHSRSRKVTILAYEGLDDRPFPRLLARTKIDLARGLVDVFDYASWSEPELLYMKSRFLPRNHPELERQLAFERRLLETGMFDEDGRGPPASELMRILQSKEAR